MTAEQEAAEAVKDWVVSNFELTSNDVEVNDHSGESYVSVTVHDSGWQGFNTEKARDVVSNNTSHRVDSVLESGSTLSFTLD